jgi:hypothetical protein
MKTEIIILLCVVAFILGIIVANYSNPCDCSSEKAMYDVSIQRVQLDYDRLSLECKIIEDDRDYQHKLYTKELDSYLKLYEICST